MSTTKPAVTSKKVTGAINKEIIPSSIRIELDKKNIAENAAATLLPYLQQRILKLMLPQINEKARSDAQFIAINMARFCEYCRQRMCNEVKLEHTLLVDVQRNTVQGFPILSKEIGVFLMDPIKYVNHMRLLMHPGRKVAIRSSL